MLRILGVLFISFLISSCLEFKDSVFDTATGVSQNWNSRFRVANYNLGAGDLVRFGIFSDSHQNYSDLDKTLQHMDVVGVDFAVFTGDMTDIGTRDEYEIFYAFLQDAKYPIYVVPGNHDLTTTGRIMYRKIFGPENSFLDTSFGRMIFFNNNPLELLPETVNYNFLSSAVSGANAANPLFVFHHQDPANQTSFSASDQALYQGLVTGFGNSVYVFHGHLHSFNRTQIGGNTEVFQVSRVEKQKWALVEIDNVEVRVYFCERRACTKVFP
jgi:predicted phosphodiesterase